MTDARPQVLLHLCCGPCATHSIDVLRRNYRPLLFWSDANIAPRAEYDRRLHFARCVADHFQLALHVDDYLHEQWLTHIGGLETQPEGAERCRRCFAFSFARSAAFAVAQGISLFTTTLTISPHKRNDVIHEEGRAAAQAAGLSFLELDFDADDGFRKSVSWSGELKLYRQNYCGCEFSLRDRRL